MVQWIENKNELKYSNWNDYKKFERMILNQQIRFTYKSLKRYIIEKHVKYLKSWDLTSNIVIRELPDEPPDQNNKEQVAFHNLAKEETESLKYFMKNVDNETAINMLFATNTENDFTRLMDKYSISKREIIDKCYKLLSNTIEDYSYTNHRYKNYESHYSRHNYYDNNSNNYYNHYNHRFHRNNDSYYDYNRRSSFYGNYHSDSYRYKDNNDTEEVRDYRNASSKELPANNEIVNNDRDKHSNKEGSRVDHSNYRGKEGYAGYYTSSGKYHRDRYGSRSKHYLPSSDYRHGYSSSGYSHRRSSYRRSSHHRRSSSRRRSRSRHNR